MQLTNLVRRHVMGNISEKLNDLFAAAAFAEEGEFDAARELVKQKRRILLALSGGDMDKDTMVYAKNTSMRIGAELDILCTGDFDESDTVFQSALQELKRAGVVFKVTTAKGCIKDEIVHFTKANKDVVFVIVNSYDDLKVECKGKSSALDIFVAKLKCPLVVIREDVFQS
jgi:hypothetical protein